MWRTVALCGGFLAGGLVLGWLWGSRGHGASGTTPTKPVRAELEAHAKRLFANPGGQMDRTGSARVRKELEAAGPNVQRQSGLRPELIDALLREGKVREACDEADAFIAALKRFPGVLEKEILPHQLRGLAYLRLSEVENCINRHNDECCVFPLKGGGVHAEKMPAEQASKSFLDVLRIKPDDLKARWLLNITHMAMGTYPASVPAKFLIPEKAPNSVDDFPRYREIAVSCGIDLINHAGGVVADDIDGDGLLDLVVSSICPTTPLTYLRNVGDGTFEDRTPASGLEDQLGGLNLVGNDYDNDGDVDLFVMRGGWLYDEGRIRNSLLRNEGGGRFTDVTHAAGVAKPEFPTQVGVWFDYDNDGDLDVFVGNESRAESRFALDGNVSYPCNLFRNEGNGRFTDVAEQAGVTNDRFCKGATAGDYDNDGWVDLYVSNIGENRLYRNLGNGRFIDVAPSLRVTEPANRSFAPWFFDVDNDGDLDIFVGAYDSTVEDIAAWHLGMPFKSSAPRLYRNKGDGTFEDVTRSFELWRPAAPMGANFGDLDNDGWLDIYLSTGAPDYEALMPNVMFRNAGGKNFRDVTVAGGFGNLQKGHGVAFVDLDNDGDQDIFNQTGGFYQGDAFYNALYENPTSDARFLTLKLIGTRTNRLAYGARVKVVVETPSGRREIHRAVGSVSSFGGSPSRQEIGLGDATAIHSVEIFWPRSGIRQSVTLLSLDSFYEITEGAADPRKIEPKRFRLGRS